VNTKNNCLEQIRRSREAFNFIYLEVFLELERSLMIESDNIFGKIFPWVRTYKENLFLLNQTISQESRKEHRIIKSAASEYLSQRNLKAHEEEIFKEIFRKHRRLIDRSYLTDKLSFKRVISKRKSTHKDSVKILDIIFDYVDSYNK